MIYLDSSVALAYLLGEDRTPPVSLWRSTVTIASYDARLIAAARQLGLEIADV